MRGLALSLLGIFLFGASGGAYADLALTGPLGLVTFQRQPDGRYVKIFEQPNYLRLHWPNSDHPDQAEMVASGVILGGIGGQLFKIGNVSDLGARGAFPFAEAPPTQFWLVPRPSKAFDLDRPVSANNRAMEDEGLGYAPAQIVGLRQWTDHTSAEPSDLELVAAYPEPSLPDHLGYTVIPLTPPAAEPQRYELPDFENPKQVTAGLDLAGDQVDSVRIIGFDPLNSSLIWVGWSVEIARAREAHGKFKVFPVPVIWLLSPGGADPVERIAEWSRRTKISDGNLAVSDGNWRTTGQIELSYPASLRDKNFREVTQAWVAEFHEKVVVAIEHTVFWGCAGKILRPRKAE